MEYYSSFKKREILTHAMTWINLENSMLSKTTSHKKTNVVWFHLYEVTRVVTFLETKYSGGYQGLGEEGIGS